MQWYLEVLRKFAMFDGRAHRTEFWMFTLVNVVITIILTLADVATGLYGDYGGPISGTYSLAMLIPSLAVGARRLHDIDRTGWWQLLGIIPLLGLIPLIIFWAQAGDPEPNDHGRNPWAAAPQPAG